MSVTTVPLRPVSKSGLVLLWAALALLIAAGIGYAVYGTPANFTVVKEGEGPQPTDQDVAIIKYKGTLADGKVFDESEQAPLPVAQSVPGFRKALKRMKTGGKYKIVIAPEDGYGDQQAGPIPPNSTLYFDVELLQVMPRQQFEQMMQMMQQQQMQGGAPGAAPLPGR